jgi:hypothetical protein
MANFAWVMCLMRVASTNRISQRYHVSAGQTAAHFLSWSSTLGWCMFPKCRFQRDGGHPGPNDIPDEFADNIVGKLTKGIQARMQLGGDDGSPAKKTKQEPSNP